MKRILVVLTLVLVSTFSIAGRAATAPEQISKKQLSTLIATAKTPAEHERIAQYYRAQSANLLAQSQQHAQMAEQFRGNSATNNAKVAQQTVNHCEYLAQSLKAKAARAQQLAEQHEEMARAAQ